MTKPEIPIEESMDGVLIAAAEFKKAGLDVDDLTTEDVINLVMDIAKEDGYEVGQGRATGDRSEPYCHGLASGQFGRQPEV